jgi:hypothetical protein
MKTELDKALVLFIAENDHCSVIVAMNQRTKLTPWRRILQEKKQRAVELFKKFLEFNGTEGSLPRSKEPVSGSHHEPDKSSPHPHILFLQYLF